MSPSFDHQAPSDLPSRLEEIRALREECPVAWSEEHGGFWVASRYEDVCRVLQDHESFSSAKTLDEDGVWHGGIGIPSLQMPLPAMPTEYDPPLATEYRRVINPLVLPPAVEAYRPKLLAFSTEMIDRVIETGRFDIVHDFALPVPAMVVLDLLGFPPDEWEAFAGPCHGLVSHLPGTPAHDQALEGNRWIVEQLASAIASRRDAEARGDVVDYLLAARIDGQPLTEEVMLSAAYTLIIAAIDTTSALVSNALLYLSRRPDVRTQLVEDLDLLPLACEEFLRWSSPAHATARLVKNDVVLGDQQPQVGDAVYVSIASANHDADVFDDPDNVNIGRSPNRHVAFGLGVHKCLGMHLARAEFHVMMQQVLERMPDYRVIEDEAIPFDTIANVNGWTKMPAMFTPGPRARVSTNAVTDVAQ